MKRSELISLIQEETKKILKESTEMYSTEYYDRIGEHGEINHSTSFDKQVSEAERLLRDESKKGELGKSTLYIGVSGQGNKFAIIYLHPDYLKNRLNAFDFKTPSDHKAWSDAAKEYLKTKKMVVGYYPGVKTKDDKKSNEYYKNSIKESNTDSFIGVYANNKKDRDNFYKEVKGLMPGHHYEVLGDTGIQIFADKRDLEDVKRIAKNNNIDDENVVLSENKRSLKESKGYSNDNLAKLGDTVEMKSRSGAVTSGIKGIVYKISNGGRFFCLQDEHGNKSNKVYDVRDFKTAKITPAPIKESDDELKCAIKEMISQMLKEEVNDITAGKLDDYFRLILKQCKKVKYEKYPENTFYIYTPKGKEVSVYFETEGTGRDERVYYSDSLWSSIQTKFNLEDDDYNIVAPKLRELIKKYIGIGNAEMEHSTDRLGWSYLDKSKMGKRLNEGAVKNKLLEDRTNLQKAIEFFTTKYRLREAAVEKWLVDNKINIEKIFTDAVNNKLNYLDFITAVSGNYGNKYSRRLVSMYK